MPGPGTRRERLKALGLDRVLVLHRGNVELALPRGQTVTSAPSGAERGRAEMAWTDDAIWAVPVWERTAETIELGDGVPRETPRDRWSLRDS